MSGNNYNRDKYDINKAASNLESEYNPNKYNLDKAAKDLSKNK